MPWETEFFLWQIFLARRRSAVEMRYKNSKCKACWGANVRLWKWREVRWKTYWALESKFGAFLSSPVIFLCINFCFVNNTFHRNTDLGQYGFLPFSLLHLSKEMICSQCEMLVCGFCFTWQTMTLFTLGPIPGKGQTFNYRNQQEVAGPRCIRQEKSGLYFFLPPLLLLADLN